MNKFDNYVYLSVCEFTIETFKKSSYRTFSMYCKQLYHSINDNSFNRFETETMVYITDKLRLVYGLNDAEILYYLTSFYMMPVEMIHQYQVCVETNIRCFRSAFN